VLNIAQLLSYSVVAVILLLYGCNNYLYFFFQSENLNVLFVAIHDEAFDVQEKAIQTIGRLSKLNPAYVMPMLRKTHIQVMIIL